jgi:hypothetical protein
MSIGLGKLFLGFILPWAGILSNDSLLPKGFSAEITVRGLFI